MNYSKPLQYYQLVVIGIVHLTIDFFGGILPVIMPAIQKRFAISITAGIGLLSILNITCNFTQVAMGHIRKDCKEPLMLPLGVVFLGGLCFIAAVPASSSWVWLTIPLIILTAVGIAITHPESLRAIHYLGGIAPSLSSAVYLNFGYIGFALGGWVAAWIISQFGFNGLYLLISLPLIGLGLLYKYKIKLAVESDFDKPEHNLFKIRKVNFLVLMMMAIPITTATTILFALVPQRLNQLGFDLPFGGFSLMIYVAGLGVGSFFWSWVAHKKGEMLSSVLSLFIGTPLFIAYLYFIQYKLAVLFIFGGGFCCGAAYPLIVTLARYAVGFNLGQRMGFIVGGAWGVASIILLMLAPVADRYGTDLVLVSVPMFYVVSAIIGVSVLMTTKRIEVGSNDIV